MPWLQNWKWQSNDHFLFYTLWGHFKICPGAGDTAVIWAEPTTSVSIWVQRKPTVWTGGGGLCPEEGVCCSSDAFGKLWKEMEAYFCSFGRGCVTSFHFCPTPNIHVVVPVTSSVSGNFHSAYESYWLAKFLTISGIFLIWLTEFLPCSWSQGNARQFYL